jgi:hypothetical protein
MKRNYIFYSVLLASAFSFVQCSDDEPTATPTCLPTELPVEEGMLTITYNTSNQPTDIDFVSEDEPEEDYSQDAEYSGGKLSRFNFYLDEELGAYKTFEHTSGKIVEHVFYQNGEDEFQEYSRYVYYLQNDRITSRTLHENWSDFLMVDSLTYTYNAAGNIIRVDNYDDTHAFNYKTEITYDDKINPYHLSGLTDSDNEFFTEANLSVNNITKAVYTSEDWTEEEVVVYTYDTEGKPVTRKGSWEPAARTIAWNCQ